LDNPKMDLFSVVVAITPDTQAAECFHLGDVILAIDGVTLQKKRHAMQELLMQAAITNPQSAQAHGTYNFHVLRAGHPPRVELGFACSLLNVAQCGCPRCDRLV